MEKFQKFYQGDFYNESDYVGFGRIFQTTEIENSNSILYDFHWHVSDIMIVTIVKNDKGLIDLGIPRISISNSFSEISELEFLAIRKEAARGFARWIEIFVKIVSNNGSYLCFENIDSYIIHFPNEKLTFEGTKSIYNFDFKDDENFKVYRLRITDDDSNIQNTIERKSFKESRMDPISIQFIWAEFLPDINDILIMNSINSHNT